MGLRLTRTVAGAALVAATIWSGLAPTTAAAADKVSVSLSYTPWAAYLPVYVGMQRGFYEKKGLEVEIKTNRGAAATTLVGSGQEQFSYIDPAAALTARAKGVPIVILATTNQDNGAALFATEKSGITKVEDMKGRNVGAFTGSQTTIFLQALLNKHGMSMNDVNIVTVRSGTDLPLALNGGIDAEVTIFNNELVSWPIEHPELKLKVWRLRDLGFDTPGYGLVAGEKLVAENPDLAKRFVDATIEALAYAIKNPEDSIKALTTSVPELKPEIEMAKWRAILPTATGPVTEAHGLGAVDRAKFETLQKVLLTYKVTDKEVELDKFIRDELRSDKK